MRVPAFISVSFRCLVLYLVGGIVTNTVGAATEDWTPSERESTALAEKLARWSALLRDCKAEAAVRKEFRELVLVGLNSYTGVRNHKATALAFDKAVSGESVVEATPASCAAVAFKAGQQTQLFGMRVAWRQKNPTLLPARVQAERIVDLLAMMSMFVASPMERCIESDLLRDEILHDYVQAMNSWMQQRGLNDSMPGISPFVRAKPENRAKLDPDNPHCIGHLYGAGQYAQIVISAVLEEDTEESRWVNRQAVLISRKK